MSPPVKARSVVAVSRRQYSVPVIFVAKAWSNQEPRDCFVESGGYDSFMSSRARVLFHIGCRKVRSCSLEKEV